MNGMAFRTKHSECEAPVAQVLHGKQKTSRHPVIKSDFLCMVEYKEANMRGLNDDLQDDLTEAEKGWNRDVEKFRTDIG